jgi:hypothetical protein
MLMNCSGQDGFSQMSYTILQYVDMIVFSFGMNYGSS